jgi:hypothetical protein
MRWFRRGSADNQVVLDPGRQQALIQEIRQRFNPSARVRFDEQAAAIAPMLGTDDNALAVAVRIVRDTAEEAYADVYAQVSDVSRRSGHQYAVDRRNYRALWRHFGPHLRTPLFNLPCGFHPYIHVAAAVAVIGVHPARIMTLPGSNALLPHMLEVLDLTTAGWEFGSVPVGSDAAHLASRLISVSRQVIDTMDEPPPLPPPVRETMRRNNTTNVIDPNGAVIGGVNLGAEMRRIFLT